MSVMPGIYSLVNTTTADRYVGQSVHMPARIQGHFRDLRLGTHINFKMRESAATHGWQVFKSEYLATPPPSLPRFGDCWTSMWVLANWLNRAEAKFVRKLKPTFNIAGIPKPRRKPTPFLADYDDEELADDNCRIDDGFVGTPSGLMLSLESRSAHNPNAEIVRSAIDHLPSRERFVIESLYGLSGREESFSTVAMALQVSRQRILQIREKALSRLYAILLQSKD